MNTKPRGSGTSVVESDIGVIDTVLSNDTASTTKPLRVLSGAIPKLELDASNVAIPRLFLCVTLQPAGADQLDVAAVAPSLLNWTSKSVSLCFGSSGGNPDRFKTPTVNGCVVLVEVWVTVNSRLLEPIDSPRVGIAKAPDSMVAAKRVNLDRMVFLPVGLTVRNATIAIILRPALAQTVNK
jgi:hypothetical protein